MDKKNNTLGKGSNKKKKKVGNLFMIFFQHTRVKFALFIDAIHDIWNWGKGYKGILIEYFPKNCWVFKGYLDL